MNLLYGELSLPIQPLVLHKIMAFKAFMNSQTAKCCGTVTGQSYSPMGMLPKVHAYKVFVKEHGLPNKNENNKVSDRACLGYLV